MKKVSVIIPAYRCAATLRQAIDSALFQEVPLEILVLDDCSGLCFKKELTEEEHAKRAELRIKFKNLSAELSGAARERFEDIERRRKAND